MIQNDTSPIGLYVTLSASNLPATGKTLTITVSKNGGAFAAGLGTVAEDTGTAFAGWYHYTPTVAEVGTLGDLRILATAAGCWDTPFVDRVQQAGALAVDWTSGRAAEIDTINTTTTAIAGYVDTEVAAIKAKTDALALDGSGGVSIAAADKTALLNTILGAVIETNGGITVTVKQALQLAAALPAGAIADILAGAGTQTIHVASASGQPFLTIVGDELGNRAVTRLSLS